MSAIAYEANYYTIGHAGHESEVSTSYHLYASYLFNTGYGIVPMIFAGIGAMLVLTKKFWKAMLIVIFPILFFIFVGKYKVYFSRNVVAIIPFLSLLSAVFVTVVYNRIVSYFPYFRTSQHSVILGAVFLLGISASIWGQLYSSISHINRITLPDTRWVSVEWIINSIPPGSKIGREHYTPPIEDWSDKYRSKYLGYFAVIKRPEIVSTMDYMIVSSSDYGRYTNNSIKYPTEAKRYNDFFAQHELVKEFIPDNQMTGPKISIYRLRGTQQ